MLKIFVLGVSFGRLYQSCMYLVHVSLMSPKSIGIVAVAEVALKISVLEALIWCSLSELVIPGTFTFPDSKIDWDCCCGPGGVENLCPWSLSFGVVY